MKKKSKYKKSILIYTSILLILMIVASIYVYFSLKDFERNQPDKFILNVVDELKTNPNKYKTIKKEHIEGYKDILKNSKITVESEKQDYIVLADEMPIFNVKLNNGPKKVKLSLLSYHVLSIKELKPVNDDGAYAITVTIPGSFKLKVNGSDYTKILKKEKNPDLEEIDTDLLPENYIYKVTGFSKKPKIEIFDNKNNLIKYTPSNHIVINKFYETDDYQKNIKDSIDVLAFARNWSLFFTNDLKGGRGGFDTLKEYLIPDSKMWNSAETWIKSVDRRFVSRHTFKDPAFTNESVTNCHIYSDTAFSCLVKLDKNLLVGNKKEEQVDKLNDRMYFAYTDGWKFIDMRVNLD